MSPRRAVLALLSAVPGCLCGGDGVNRGDLNLMSLDEEWMQTHPLTEERITWAQEAAEALPSAGHRLTDPDFEQIQRRVAPFNEITM